MNKDTAQRPIFRHEADNSQLAITKIEELGLSRSFFKIKKRFTKSEQTLFFSEETVKQILEDTKFDSTHELQEKFIDELNAEFGENTVRFKVGEKNLSITCKYKDCSFRLNYSFTSSPDG